MVTKSSLCTLIAISVFTLLTGCRTQPTQPTQPGSPNQQPRPETPTGPITTVPPTSEIPPQPAREEPKKVAVILGPGGAKAFAHVGVLKALQQQRIPVEKVIGLEWGALVGGLYANKGQVHDVEWKLYKMQPQSLPYSNSGIFSRQKIGEESIKVIDGFLNDAFGKDEIGRAKVPFICPSRSVWTGVVAWQNRGSFRDAMKRCLQYPPVFKVQGTFMAGASQAAEGVELLAKEGFNVVVLVNVLGSAMPVEQDGLLDNLDYVILWQEVRRAISEASKLKVETITVDTSDFPVLKFDAKKELIQLGESAGRKAATSLISKYRF